MGRPRKTETRSRQLKFCLTESELENIKRRAEAVGMRPVNFGRALLLDQFRRVARNDPQKAISTR